MSEKNIPELLAPAGSPLALKAAIEGGADAVYMGGASFNARINAKNFTPEELCEGVQLAHAYGVKIYLTYNTLIYDREREDFLRAAEQAYLSGVDALIVADIGMSAEIKKRIPIELHASTQLSGHNVAAAELLRSAGFSRMVCAREMSREDIRNFCLSSPIEAEVFVHGALCVSTSGQCLFSSVVGGRSGNRGECAQPCRLPYSTGNGKSGFPLSLCDNSLAAHLCDLTDFGVASLKIEGRMKSPEYVRDVTSIFRTLLDEHRNASKEELSELAKIFSRGGLTDGYYTQRLDRKMLGIRSDNDKKQTAELAPFDKITRRLPLDLTASIKLGEPMKLTASTCGGSVTVYGDIPQAAVNAPLSAEVVQRNLSKLGATAYTLNKFDLSLDDGVMLPISALNALRRSAIDALGTKNDRTQAEISHATLAKPKSNKKNFKSAVFYEPSQIPDEAYDYFDRIFVPLDRYSECPDPSLGVLLPETVFDSQRNEVEAMLASARALGATDALVGNFGHIELAKKFGFNLHGEFRLNITNASSAAEAEKMGFESFILSPELSLPQLRDIGGASVVTVYGRLPLMLTEKCIGKELGGCEKCKSGKSVLVDRRGVSFPVLRRFEHRSVIFNSVPLYMADRREILEKNGLLAWHFIFSTESKREAAEIISAYRLGKQYKNDNVRRIK